MPTKQTPPPPPPKTPFPAWFAVVVTVLVLYFAYLFMPDALDGQRVYDIPYSQFKQYAQDGWVAEVNVQGANLRGKLIEPKPIGPRGETGQSFSSYIPVIGDDELMPLLREQKVLIRAQPEAPGYGSLLLSFLPWVVFIGLWFWIMHRVSRNVAGGLGKQGELSKFLQSETKRAEVPDVSFEDVAGQENAKREVIELVEYLRNPDQFRKLGAEVPRGILLMGPPGTGKTLLARALAGEAGVPFYSISGSEFIEVFVGVGASRVRRLFETAKQHAPSILFIDELDSVGRMRGTGLGGGHDEREQTLNQILAEMDGFAGHEAVVVLAATNRPDVLDTALLRPGRFDRHVILDLPDTEDRLKILKVHVRKVPMAEDVDLQQIAAGTPGFSGADLKNLVNEAAIFAARKKDSKVRMAHFDDARDKILLGTVRTMAILPEEKHRLAVHEAGHTLVAYFCEYADPLYKVTIIPRGHALGGTHQLPEAERHTLPEEYLRDRLAVMLGGRAAEKELLHSVSSGADDDIKQATSLARAMVSRWGMSAEVGPMDLRESEAHPFLGREIAQPHHYSERAENAVDEAVKKFLVDAEQHAFDFIRQHRVQLNRLIDALKEKETLYKEDIMKCLEPTRLAISNAERSEKGRGATRSD